MAARGYRAVHVPPEKGELLMADDEDAKVGVMAVRLPLLILGSLILLLAIGLLIYKVA